MPLGNDIVDLAAEAAPHPGFAARILTPTELAAFAQADESVVWLWQAWAAKEAAFKLMKRLRPTASFTPRQLQVSVDFKKVMVEELVIETSFQMEPEFIHCLAGLPLAGAIAFVASEDEMQRLLAATPELLPEEQRLNLSLSSQAVRVLAVRKLGETLGCVPEALRIVAGPKMPPRVYRGTEEAPITLSMSHHGRYVAVAFETY